MTIAELTPDTALAALLDGKVEVQTSKTKKYAVRAYEQAKMPNKGLADEFLSVQWNGGARSRSERLGIYQGELVLTIYCKLQTDNTAKTHRIRQILEQCQGLIHRKRSQGIFFTFNPMNVIMPTTPNLTNGYSTTALNVEWHT